MLVVTWNRTLKHLCFSLRGPATALKAAFPVAHGAPFSLDLSSSLLVPSFRSHTFDLVLIKLKPYFSVR